jgi:hypothetical protein
MWTGMEWQNSAPTFVVGRRKIKIKELQSPATRAWASDSDLTLPQGLASNPNTQRHL